MEVLPWRDLDFPRLRGFLATESSTEGVACLLQPANVPPSSLRQGGWDASDAQGENSRRQLFTQRRRETGAVSFSAETPREGDIVKRVLITTEPGNGVWTFCIELGAALVEREVEVTLAVMGGAPSDDQRRQAWAAGIDLEVGAFRVEWMEDPWDDLQRAGEWLLELEALLHPDVIHLNEFALATTPFSAPVVVTAHSCALSWWEAVHGTRPPERLATYHAAVRRGIEAADLLAVPTRSLLLALDRHYGPKDPARIIPMARRAELFPPGPKRSLVLSAGRLWDAARNLDLVARAAPRIPWPVAIAGETFHSNGSLQEPTNVRLLGQLDETHLSWWFSRAAIFALPARYEPSGAGALEAALAGCALVLGDIPSLREVWGEAATFTSPDDEAGFVGRILRLIGDPAQLARLGASARERALELAPAAMAEGYLAAYSEAAAPRRRAVPPIPIPFEVGAPLPQAMAAV